MSDRDSYLQEMYHNNRPAWNENSANQSKIFFKSNCVPKFRDNNDLVLDYCKGKLKSESSTSIFFIFFIFILGVGIGILIYYLISKK